ncbi:hypothetical protein CA13_44970 [Planctomycetes bacterium CA13]|uniref:HAMP domain-containing protein n=1 Tax=Novipirellula herctigrandis TaxID=2527986 RepID=A0A5C5Z6X1_9BACT|nr:hypothetical protein CA13_44970 [Planctomycetes bacterium CA13]
MKWKKMPAISTRKYVVADPHVQGAILRRVGLYALAAIAYYSVVLFFSIYATGRVGTTTDRLFECLDDIITWLPGLFVLGPIAAYDLLTTTNRFAGPICRLRREMKMLVDDESPRELTFRENDHWSEVAKHYNELRQELLELRAESAQNGGRHKNNLNEEMAEVLI